MFRFPKSLILAVIAVAPVACSAGTSAPGADQAAPVLTGKAAFTDAAHESPGTRRHLTAADLPAACCPSNPSTTAPAWSPARPMPGPRLPRDSRSNSTPPASTIRASCAPPPTATSFSPRAKPARSAFFAASTPTASRSRPQSSPKACTSLSASPSIRPGPNPEVCLHRRHRRDRSLPLQKRRSEGHAARWRTWPNCPAADASAAAATGPATSSSPKTASSLFASVGSHSNVDDPDTHPEEFHRADVLEFTPDGKFVKVYASGIRNCVGEAINPITGELWCSTNERDALGNNLVPDYVTHVQEGGFYGWPWYYMGAHGAPGPAPRGQAPRTAVQGHHARRSREPALRVAGNAVLRGLAVSRRVSRATASPAEHGSWNRANRSGYEVIRLPMKNGHATGEYEDFLTGFTVGDGNVGAAPSASPSPKMARCSSPTTAPTPSGA